MGGTLEMNDNTIYSAYIGYIANIYFTSNSGGEVLLEFPNYCKISPPIEYYFWTYFEIETCGYIKLKRGLPEFVYKEVCNEIRRIKSESDQYLWGI